MRHTFLTFQKIKPQLQHVIDTQDVKERGKYWYAAEGLDVSNLRSSLTHEFIDFLGRHTLQVIQDRSCIKGMGNS